MAITRFDAVQIVRFVAYQVPWPTVVNDLYIHDSRYAGISIDGFLKGLKISQYQPSMPEMPK